MPLLKLPQFVLLVFILAGPQLVNAKTFSYKHFSVEDGLPTSEVYDVLQDDDGFIWFGTDRGVLKFNGHKFEIFNSETGLVDEVVFHLKKDHDGKIWAASISGKLCYYENNSFTPFKYNHILEKEVQAGLISSFHIDSSNTVYIGYHNRDAITIEANGAFSRNQSGNIDNAILEFDKEAIHIRSNLNAPENSNKKGIAVITPQGHESIEIPKTIEVSPDIVEIYKVPNRDIIYFAIANHLLRKKGSTVTHCFTGESEITAINFYNGEIWIGMFKSGYAVLNANGEKVKSDLLNYSVSDFLFDRQGSVWITTLEDGIYYLPNPYHYSLTRKEGLCSNHISRIIGVSEELIVCDREGNIIIIYLEKENKTDTIYESAQKKTLPYFYNKYSETLSINCGENELKTAGSKTHIVNSNEEYLCSFSADSTLILMSKSNLGILYNGEFDSLIFDSTGTPFNSFSYHVDLKKRLFAYGVTGITQIEKVGLKYRMKDWKEIHPIYSTRIEKIINHDRFDFVAATRGEGVLFVKDNNPYLVKKKHGLLSNQITSIFADANGEIWLGCSKGLMLLDKNSNLRFITQEHGLISNEVTDIFVNEQHVYVGTKKGISVLNKNYLFGDTLNIPVYFETFSVMNSELNSSDIRNVDLPYREHSLEVNFVGLNYKSMGKIKYRYRLNPNAGWKYTNANQLSFTNLASGNYILEIQASNGENGWTKEPATLGINVAYPFWRTWFFIISTSTLFLILLVLIYRFALKRVKKRADLKQQIQTLRFEALNAQMNPHFMFNSLNSIQNFIMQNEKKASVRYLSKFAKLMRLTLNHSQRKHILLEEELKSLELYLTLEMLRFDQQFDYELVIDSNVDQQNTLIPALLIQPIVENAILHGIRPLESSGHIEIRLTQKSNQLTIEVEDNGVGRNSKKMNGQEKKADGHQSKGSLMTEERIALFAKEFKGEYDYKIIDLKINGTPSGTKVVLAIPYIPNTIL